MKANELQLIFSLIRRWTWLLLMGAILGGGVAYAYSISQPPVYRASTKLMVSQPAESLSSDLTSITDKELAETFRNMIILRPILEATSEQIGFLVSDDQISSNIIGGTKLLDITVQDEDPERAALITNALVDSLIKHNEFLQFGRFESSEKSLQAQITQVESQIAEISTQQDEEAIQNRFTEEELAERQQELKDTILDLSNQSAVLEQEIMDLTTLIAEPPSLSPFNRDLLSKKQAELVLLQLKLSSGQLQYQALIEDGASDIKLQRWQEDILESVDQSIVLQWEIDNFSKPEKPSIANLERRDSLNEKRAELAFIQLNLDIANGRYQQLILPDEEIDRQEDQITSVQNANLGLYQQIYSSLLNNYESVRLARLQSTPSIVQVDRAVPGKPIQANALSNAILGAVVGLIVMGSIAFMIEYLDDTLKTPADINEILGLPVIGYVAETPELGDKMGEGKDRVGPFVSNNPRAPLGEAFRTLRTNLEFADVDNPLNTILITSPGPGEGKTTIAANLAAVFAQQQKRVIMLDCDLRRPSLHKIFDVSNRVGLSNVLLGQLEIQNAIYTFDRELAIIPSGILPSNPAELLSSDRMTQFLKELVEVSDVVVIDSPPSLVSDATVLSAKVDCVVVIIQPGHTRTDDALAQLEQLRRAGAHVVGVVLSQIPRKQSGYYGRYSYKYRYYDYDQDDSNRSKRKGKFGWWPFGKKSVVKQEGVRTDMEDDI